MYSFNVTEGSVAYTVYFFAAFTGHFQPFTPVDPLEFDEIHRALIKYDRAPYVQGWYSETASGPRLDKLIKFRLIRGSFKGTFDQKKEPGTYYHRLVKIDGKWLAKETITPLVVLKQKHYLRYSIDKDGKLENAYHIYSTIMNSYIYTYNSDGTLKNTKNNTHKTPSEIPDF